MTGAYRSDQAFWQHAGIFSDRLDAKQMLEARASRSIQATAGESAGGNRGGPRKMAQGHDEAQARNHSHLGSVSG